MKYLGDFVAGVAVYVPWSTTAVAGESITRGTNGSIRIYKNDSTTQRSSSAGITDSEDFDTLTGLHLVKIDLNDNTDSGFYAAGNDYFVVIQGTVIDGKTLNVPLAHFSIENRFGKAQIAALEAKVDIIDGIVDALKIVSDNLAGMYETDGGVKRWTANALEQGPAGGGGGGSCQWSSGDVEGARHRLGVDGTATAPSATPSLATAAAVATVAGYLDTEVASIISSLSTISGYLDTEVASVLASLARLEALSYTRTGTAQAGAAGTITFDAGASSTNDFYNGQVVFIVSGTGAGQARVISDYVGSTKVASVHANWATNPSSSSVFYILPLVTIAADTTAILDILGTPTGSTFADDLQTITGKTSLIPASPAEAGGEITLTSDQLIAIAAGILDLANGVETGLTVRESLRLMAASAGGKVSGAASSTVLVRNAKADSKTRMSVTTDASGNRSAIVYDLS